MKHIVLEFLNIFFFVFHTGLIIFNVLGWVFKQTRKYNLMTLFLTLFSWAGLGIFFGFGYCPCTHWHWLVREQLGYIDNTSSYIHFLFIKLLKLFISRDLLNIGTIVVFFTSLAVSLLLNIRNFIKDKSKKNLHRPL